MFGIKIAGKYFRKSDSHGRLENRVIALASAVVNLTTGKWIKCTSDIRIPMTQRERKAYRNAPFLLLRNSFTGNLDGSRGMLTVWEDDEMGPITPDQTQAYKAGWRAADTWRGYTISGVSGITA